MFLKHFHGPKDKKLIFNFFISINRDSTERHVRLKISTIPSFVLDMGHVFLAAVDLPFEEMKVVDIMKVGDYVLTGMMNPIESGICRYERSEVIL